MQTSKWAIVSDVLSTFTGSLVSVVSCLTPIIICMSNNPIEVKIAAMGAGSVGSFAGSMIARQQPTSLRDIAMRESLKP